jgi:predicted alpha/beta-fold hydrolase
VNVAIPARPFVARRRLTNGHVMTVYAWARRRHFPALPRPEARLFQVSPDTQVLAHCYWQTPRAHRPTLVALHGLEGSSDAHYMRGLADKAWRRGWNAVLLNQRNCGGTEALTPGLYHSGLTEDPRAVIRELAKVDGIRAVGVVGYSLGGNLTLKLAGELDGAPDVPVQGVVAISPTADLDVCVHALERRANYAYQWNFVRHLKARMRRKNAAWPGRFDLTPLDRIRTIRDFDDAYTAPYHGFAGALDYYRRASSMRVADRIRVPALVLSAADDPFVPGSQFLDPAIATNPAVHIRVETHGGHCGFVAEPQADDDDGYWAEAAALAFLASVMPSGSPAR